MKKLNGITILVVDDEEELREVLRDDLEYEGATVIDAANGKIALEKLKKFNVDIVISDVRMPIYSGIELLKELRTDFPILPVFFLCTGYTDTTKENAKALGANALIGKPYDMSALVVSIIKVLGSLT